MQDLTLTRGIALGNGSLDVSSGTWIQQGIISGNALTKTGTGTLFLTATNTYTGNTSINGGVLGINSLSNIGAGTMSFNGGQLQATGFTLASTLTFNSGGGGFHIETGTLTYSGTILGTGALTKSGTGVLALTGSLNGYAGAMNMNGGILAITNNGNLTGGALSFNGGTMRAATLTMNRDWTLNTAGGGVDVTSGTFTHSGLISGTGGLVKSGAGLLIINGTNTYQGATAINGGILSFTNTANLGNASGGLSFNTGTLQAIGVIARATTLNAGGGTLDIASQLSMTGSISGAGGLTKIGSGTLTLTGTNSYTGTTAVNTGALSVANDTNLGSSSAALALNAATLRTTGGFSMNRATSLSGGSTFDVTTGTLAHSGTISGSGGLAKTGVGQLTLAGANTYTGTTALHGGIVSVAANNNLGGSTGPLAFYSGTLRTTAGFAMNRAMALASGGATLDVESGTLTNSGTISGAAAALLTKTGTGTLVLSGLNSHTGTMAINGGVVSAGSSGNLGAGALILNSGTLRTTAGMTLANATTLNAGGGGLDVTTGTLAYNGIIGGAGALTKTGTGLLTLTATNTYAGGTVINGGKVAISSNGNLGNTNGAVSLNSGTLFASANVTMNRAFTLGAGGGFFETSGTGQTLTLQGTISGTGGLSKVGAGILELSGTNTYVGTTTVTDNSRLSVSSNANLGNSANALVLNSGILNTTASFTTDRATTVSGSGGYFVVNTGTFTHQGVISGTGMLNKSGVGVMEASGSNTYTGGTRISQGILSVASNNNLGDASGNLVMEGGTLRTTAGFTMNRATTVSLASVLDVATGTLTQQGAIAGSAALAKSGTGTLILSGSNTHTGGLAIDAGLLSVSNNANLGDAANTLALNSGTLRTTAGFTMNRALSIGAGGGTVDVTGTLTQQGAFSGTGALTKRGLGQLTLTGSSTYTGPTSVLAGVLSLQSNAVLGTGTISVDDSANEGAMLRVGATIQNGVVLGNGAVLENSGTITRTGSGLFAVRGIAGGTSTTVQNRAGAAIVSTNDHAVQLQSGGTVVNTGGRISGGFNAIYIVNNPGSVTNESGGLLHGDTQGVQMLSGGVILNTSSTISGGSIDGVSVGSVVGSTSSIQNLAGSLISGGRHGVTFVTSGTLDNDASRVSGTNTGVSGATGIVRNLAGGLIQGGSNGIHFTSSSTIINTGSSTISGGTVGIRLDAGGEITNGVGSVISGSTGVLGAGAAVTLANSGSIQGGVSLGNFANVATLDMGSVISGNLAMGSSSTARLILAGTGTQRYSDAVTGATTFSGTLTKQDAGQWTIDRAITGAAHTQVNAGKLVVTSTLGGNVTVANGAALGGSGRIGGNLSVQSGATLAPGNSIETLSVVGNASFAAGSILSLEGNGALFDRLNVGGAVTITSGAEISFSLLGPLTGTTYTLMTAASGLDGSVQFTLTGLPGGFELSYTGTELLLVALPATIGDVTVTPTDTTIITGGTTTVTVTVENTAVPNSENLNATANGDGGNVTGSGTATVVASTTGTIAPDLQFSSTTVGQAQTGTITVTDPDATNSPQTGTVTVNVLDHAYPTLLITGGNNQTVIVGANGITADMTLFNGTNGQQDLSPMDVQNLGAGVTGGTGSGIIASGSSGSYTAALNTGSVGANQEHTFSLDAGDDQTLQGALALTTQTGTVTLTVLDHAAPVFSIGSGNNQNVIVGATGITAELILANGSGTSVNLSPMTVGNLSSGLTGGTGSGLIASGGSGTYTAAITTGTVGAGQIQPFTLDAGDDQTLAGADALAQQSQDITVNVYGHAESSISGTSFNLGNVHLGYSATTSTTQLVTNGTAGAYIVDLKTSSTTSGNLTINGLSGISAGNSGTLAATLASGQGVGVINENLVITYADDSTFLGASNNLGTSTLNVTGNVYSGQGVWTSTTGGTWGTLTTNFGLNWEAAGGTPGLDASFADTDTALFGTLGSGTVTLDGSAPSLRGITFNNATDSYTLAQGSGTASLTLNGGNGAASITNAAGNHTISVPLILASAAQFSVTNALDQLSITGAIGGPGTVQIAGNGLVRYTQDQAYTGNTTVTSGVLATQNLAGAAILNGGSFSPGNVGTISSITVGSLALNGGSLLFDIGTGVSDQISITDGLASLGAATTFVFNDMGLTTGVYSLLNGLNPGWNVNLLSFSGLTGWAGTFLLSPDETMLYISLYDGAPLSGTIIQNSAPVGTPPTADFLVTGNARTNTPTQSNTINSLTFNPSTALTVFNTLNITSGNVTVGSGSATLQGGQIVAPNGFTKLGQGIINVLNDILVNGPTSIAQGTLAMNGSITTTDLIVQFGAWLKGNGVIFGNVINNGTLAPGNSPGTLTINGNFTQSSSGTLEIEVASLTNFDRLLVSGNASLAGRLNVLSFGGFNLQYGQQFAFLQAGSITGDFDSITMPNPGVFRGRFLADEGTGILIVAPTSYTLVAETQNQTNVAKALDSFISAKSGDREAVSIALDIQTADQYPAAFEAIAPGFYESLTDTTIELAVSQSQMVAQRLSAVRLGTRGFSAVGIEAPLAHDRDG